MAYNGWGNYETWAVALWIDNDQRNYSHGQLSAQNAYDNAEASESFTREEQAVIDLANELKEWIESENPLASDVSMFADLLNAALGEVDWHEIAEHLLSDVDKESEEDLAADEKES
jgi:hypothetical protein